MSAGTVLLRVTRPMTVPSLIGCKSRMPNAEIRKKLETRMPNHDLGRDPLLRISSFGFLSSFGLLVSDFSNGHSRLFFVHDSDDHPADRTFVVAHGLAGGGAIGRKDDTLMHGCAVRIDRDLRHAFRRARAINAIADNPPRTVEARVLASI